MCREAVVIASKGLLTDRREQINMNDTADSAGDNRSQTGEQVGKGAAALAFQTYPYPKEELMQGDDLAPPSVPEASPPLSIKLEPLQETFSGVAGGIEAVGTVSPVLNSDMVVKALQHRLAAAEAESARHVQIISSMHNWAAQTTTSLRQVQEKCENAELKAHKAEETAEVLRQQLSQMVAQVAAIAEVISPIGATGVVSGSEGANGKRKRKQDGLPRVGTVESLTELGNGSDQRNNCGEEI